MSLSDGGPGFWQRVRAVGHFPASCPLCGADLQQWRVAQGTPDGDDPAWTPTPTSQEPEMTEEKTRNALFDWIVDGTAVATFFVVGVLGAPS